MSPKSPRIPALRHPDIEDVLFWLAYRIPPEPFEIGSYTFDYVKLRSSPILKLRVRHTKAYNGPRKQRWLPSTDFDTMARQGQSLERLTNGVYPFVNTYKRVNDAILRIESCWNDGSGFRSKLKSTYLPPFPTTVRISGRIIMMRFKGDRRVITVETRMGLTFQASMPRDLETLASRWDYISFVARPRRRLTRTGLNIVDYAKSARLDR